MAAAAVLTPISGDARRGAAPQRLAPPAFKVACVWTGTKYGAEYVERLRDGIARHLSRPCDFVCFTDHKTVPHGVELINIAHLDLPGWWGKMALFSRGLRGEAPMLYLDLDSVIVGDLDPLADWALQAGGFGICASFTRAAGFEQWPCRFGSCAMTLPAHGWGDDVFAAFWRDRLAIMADCRYGDQQAIERLLIELGHQAGELQSVLPAGFFLGYRDLGRHSVAPPASAAVIVFGGSRKPHNCALGWVRDAWIGKAMR